MKFVAPAALVAAVLVFSVQSVNANPGYPGYSGYGYPGQMARPGYPPAMGQGYHQGYQGQPGYQGGYPQQRMMNRPNHPGMTRPGTMMKQKRQQVQPSQKPAVNLDALGSPVKVVKSFDEAWAARVKAALAITADQAPAWNAFIQALKDQIETMAALHDSMHGDGAPQISRADHRSIHKSHQQQRQELMREVEYAGMDLFDRLDPEQQGKAKYLISKYTKDQGGMGKGAKGKGMMAGHQCRP